MINKALHWIISKIIGLVAIVIMYVIFNAILFGGQYLWHYQDNKELDKINQDLSSQSSNIYKIEDQLNNLKGSLESYETQLLDLKSYITSIEDTYGNSMPQDVYDNYQDTVNEYNSTVEAYNTSSADYNTLYSEYDNRIKKYNSLVEQTNKLGEKAGVYYSIIPAPKIAGKTHFK